MLIILVGASGTGKSTIQSRICEHSNYEKIISWTTRRPRVGEVNNVDYHFITNDQFMKDIDHFAEYEEYSLGRYYGTMKGQYYQDGKNLVAVLTPHAVRQLKKNMPNLDMFVVYLTSSLKKRVIRYIERCGEKLSYSDINELNGRMERDFGMFKGFEDEADLVIKNNGDKTPFEIAYYIISYVNGREANVDD